MTMNLGTTFGDNTGGPSDDVGAAKQPFCVETADTSTGQSGTNIEQARQQVGEVGQELKGAASQATAKVSDATHRTAEHARDAAGRMVEQAKGQAKQFTQQLTQQASEQGTHLFNDQKGRAADSLGDISSALRRAAETLHEEQDKNLASYTESVADGIESCASYLRDADARRLMNDAGQFVRRRPEWVLGGAFIAGLALVRFLKASRSDTGALHHDAMGGGQQLDYATSDEFTDTGDDLVSRYRVGTHPGAGGITPTTGPDAAPTAAPDRDFARTDTARLDRSPDVTVTTPAVVPESRGTEPSTSLNPDTDTNDQSRTSPATGLSL